MRQLDLFNDQVESGGRPSERGAPSFLLIAGTNFLLLPKPRRFYLADYETLALVLALLMLWLPLTKPKTTQAPIAILGEQIQVIAQIEINPPAPPPKPSTSLSVPGRPAPLKPPVASVLVPVLMYHHVAWEDAHTNALDRALTVSPKEFEEQVAYFKNAGYETVSLQQIYNALTVGATLPSRPAVFTFDDGYEDVFIHAIPILKKHGYTGTLAIAPFLLGGNNYASWGEVLAAHQQGMEIVSHSLNHIDFTDPKYSDDFLMQELQGSKWFLESRLSAPVDFFVYPYGKYDQRAMALVEKAGYKMALTTEFGTTISLSKAFHNPRVRVAGQNGLAKLKQILGPPIISLRGR